MTSVVAVGIGSTMGLIVGFAMGFVWRHVVTRRWVIRAVEMARMNDALLDRVEALESERQQEG